MSVRSKHPLYQSGVKAYLDRDLKSFKKILSSQELSSAERLLLKARESFLSQHWDDALKHLSKVSVAAQSFLGAEKSFLSASCHFHLGQIESSSLMNLRASQIYAALTDRRGQFLALHNLMVDYSRLGLSQTARHYFEEAKKVAEGSAEKTLLCRALACEESRLENHEVACLLVEEGLRGNTSLAPTDRHAFMVVASDVFFRAGKKQQALEVLKQAKAQAGNSGFAKNVEAARIEFDLRLIEAMENKKRLPKPPQVLIKSPRYLAQWNLLLALQSGEMERAELYWRKIQGSQPGIFGKNFTCLDPSEAKSAFFTYLKQLDQSSKSTSALPLKLNGKVKALYELLKTSPAPVRKENLIEKMWKTPYHPSLDARLYKLIERAKKNQISIVSAHRAYTLK